MTTLCRIIDRLPLLLIVFAMVSYRAVHDDHQPWWLPPALLATAGGTGALLGWLKARKRNRKP